MKSRTARTTSFRLLEFEHTSPLLPPSCRALQKNIRVNAECRSIWAIMKSAPSVAPVPELLFIRWRRHPLSPPPPRMLIGFDVLRSDREAFHGGRYRFYRLYSNDLRGMQEKSGVPVKSS